MGIDLPLPEMRRGSDSLADTRHNPIKGQTVVDVRDDRLKCSCI
jgi:hypothetical protein